MTAQGDSLVLGEREESWVQGENLDPMGFTAEMGMYMLYSSVCVCVCVRVHILMCVYVNVCVVCD